MHTDELSPIPEPAKAAPKPDRIEESDRLLLENKHLTFMNLQLQQQLLAQEAQAIQTRASRVAQDMQQLQKDLADTLASLGEKYGRPIVPGALNADGTFKDPPTGS